MQFTKMHGLGNDFVIANMLENGFALSPHSITQMADRHKGVGFDQLLTIEPSDQADFFCRIFNSDGSEAKQCGNGLRCVARYLHEEKIHLHADLKLETIAGIFSIHIESYDHICVTMNTPNIEESLVTLTTETAALPAISIISTGNPHAILKVDTLESLTTDHLSADIASHSRFSDGVNIGLMQVINKHHARLRTFERGAGETLACGSNACAAAVAGIANGWLSDPVTIEFRSGCLLVRWEGEGKPVHLTGPATRVYQGNWDPK